MENLWFEDFLTDFLARFGTHFLPGSLSTVRLAVVLPAICSQ